MGGTPKHMGGTTKHGENGSKYCRFHNVQETLINAHVNVYLILMSIIVEYRISNQSDLHDIKKNNAFN